MIDDPKVYAVINAGMEATTSEALGRAADKQLVALVEPMFPEPNWSKPSRAVCASDGDDGWILFYCGPHVEMEIDTMSTRQLDQLGLGGDRWRARRHLDLGGQDRWR